MFYILEGKPEARTSTSLFRRNFRKNSRTVKNNSEDHIEMLKSRHCLNSTHIDEDGKEIYKYGDAIPGGDISNSVYACTECVPLPYEGILPPNALDWYSPLHWWDFGLIIVALSVQFRLKTIDDVS